MAVIRRVRVASVPSGHVYVQHLVADPPDARDPVRLPDRPAGAHPAAPWWPPIMLDPSWVREHADEFDLMHIHFGFDGVRPEHLAELVETLRAHGKPLVLTVHDLRNPHHLEAGLHDTQLDVLVSGADALITLTPGAAAVIRHRWGRSALVLPHPHVAPIERIQQPRPRGDGVVIGVHAKSMRAAMDPLPIIEALLELLPALPDVRLRVDAHRDVMTAGSDRLDPDLAAALHRWSAERRIELSVHDYFSDEQLWDYLSGLDVSVLPYRFGTHSGWLEACHDLGTAVVAPDCGFYDQQRACHVYSAAADRRTQTLHTAVRAAIGHPPARAVVADRRAERAHLAQAHRQLYASLTSGRLACTS